MVKIVSFNPKSHKTQVLDIFKSHPHAFPQREINILKEDLKRSPDSNCLKSVALENHQVLGYTEALRPRDSKNSWLINWLAVAKNYQRKRIGTLLIRAVEKKLKTKNALQIFIETCTCKYELPARKLYQKLGFKETATLPDYYAEEHSKVYFVKNLRNGK